MGLIQFTPITYYQKMNAYSTHRHCSRKNILSILTLTLGLLLTGCSDANKSGNKAEREALAVLKGEELYLSHGCAVCHGKKGRGDGITAQRFYPKPIDFHDSDAYIQGNSIPAIKASIRNGVRRENSAMPNYEHLTDEELKFIAHYLQSLQIQP